ncbi:hypothetical protein HZ326_11971 [Fusarium oxysporum f. sp. albedinis]|nr:hypothetical protein HZ326_11971 [Fusarium oxysporum f. sp. albedinis]
MTRESVYSPLASIRILLLVGPYYPNCPRAPLHRPLLGHDFYSSPPSALRLRLALPLLYFAVPDCCIASSHSRVSSSCLAFALPLTPCA